jgi:hypothetical protein
MIYGLKGELANYEEEKKSNVPPKQTNLLLNVGTGDDDEPLVRLR